MSGLLAVIFAVGALVGTSVVTTGPAAAAEPIHGIDVSNWQGNVDWHAVRGAGNLFAFVKATEGVTFVDRYLTQNRAGMRNAGLVLRGMYHFAHPGRNSAAAEAANFLRTVGPMSDGEVPVLDLEVEGGPATGAWAEEWMAIVAQATNRTPILYSGAYYLADVPTAGLTQYPLWVAAWGRNDGSIPSTQPRTDRWPGWTFWQYSSKGRVPGVAGYCDVNLFAGNVGELAALGRPPTPPPSPDPLGDLLRKTVDDLLTTLRGGQ